MGVGEFGVGETGSGDCLRWGGVLRIWGLGWAAGGGERWSVGDERACHEKTGLLAFSLLDNRELKKTLK